MKDVSKQTLENLITFIYCGEINGYQKDMAEFLSIAKELKIKGLADDNNYSQELFFGSQSTNLACSTPVFNGRQYQSTQTNGNEHHLDVKVQNEIENSGHDLNSNLSYNDVAPNAVDPEYNDQPENDGQVHFGDVFEENADKLDEMYDNYFRIDCLDLPLGQQEEVGTWNGTHDDGSHKIEQITSRPKPTQTKRSKGEICSYSRDN